MSRSLSRSNRFSAITAGKDAPSEGGLNATISISVASSASASPPDELHAALKRRVVAAAVAIPVRNKRIFALLTSSVRKEAPLLWKALPDKYYSRPLGRASCRERGET